MELIKEFKPSILFLAKFISLYLSLNFLYSIWVESYYPAPDPMSYWVTLHTDWTLGAFGEEVETQPSAAKPKVWLIANGRAILSVFEGCNGLNVAIIFLSFLVSFGQPNKRLLWFIPLGLMVLHLTNVARIVLLYFVTIHLEKYAYFAHKYLFTAFIFLVVFILWYLWVTRWMNEKLSTKSDESA